VSLTVSDAPLVEDEPSPEQLASDLQRTGKEITGPSALAGDWIRFWHLTFNIAKTQWKMRFFGSVLGYFWQLIRPLMLFGVLYIFWTRIIQVNKTVAGPAGDFYGAQLLGAIVMFTFLQEATMSSVRAVVDNEQLVRKIQFPRLAIPMSVVLGAVFNLCLNLLVVFIFAVASGVTPKWSWLQLIPLVALLIVLASGLAMLVSAAFVYFRDVQPIWEVILQVLFYISPVLEPLAIVSKYVHGFWLKLFMINPMAVILEQFKHAVVNHAVAGAAGYTSYALIAVTVGICFAFFGLGFYVFNRIAPNVADNI
jgi:ABC-2 type transport system permease protein